MIIKLTILLTYVDNDDNSCQMKMEMITVLGQAELPSTVVGLCCEGGNNNPFCETVYFFVATIILKHKSMLLFIHSVLKY